MTANRYEKALADPAAAFDAPESVLRDDALSDEQKIAILKQWEYDASEEAVALEEGMPGDDSDLLRRVLVALGTLTGPLDLEQTGPSKQHGLGPAAIKKPR